MVCLFVANNDEFYSSTIIKITDAEVTETYEKDGSNGVVETYTTQKLTAVFTNGEFKGKTVTFNNDYSASRVLSDKYTKGDKLFVTTQLNSESIDVTVVNQKRDHLIVLLLGVFAIVLVLAAGKRGLLTLLSLLINVSIFMICLTFGNSSKFSGLVWIALTVLFTAFTLILSSGFNTKTVGSFISVLLTCGAVFIIYYFSVYLSADLTYEAMEYSMIFFPLKKLYLVSVILGSLGAVMDVSVTVNSTVFEIAESAETLSLKNLILSVRNISKDIMGTMVNVLFFSYISSSLPIIILKMHNGYGFNEVFEYDLIFEVVRILIGSIGIVLAVPVSCFVAVLLQKRRVGLK